MLVDPGTLTEVAVAGAGAGLDVSAWSVTSVTSDTAAELFQASLLPYLAFLWFLSRKETKTPEGGTFGFAFLLVFVVATIPAGIYGMRGALPNPRYDFIRSTFDRTKSFFVCATFYPILLFLYCQFFSRQRSADSQDFFGNLRGMYNTKYTIAMILGCFASEEGVEKL